MSFLPSVLLLVVTLCALVPEAAYAFLSAPASLAPKVASLVPKIVESRRSFAQCEIRDTFGFGRRRHDIFQPLTTLFAETASRESVDVGDLESLQGLFSKYCDKEGLMTKAAVMQIPSIAELLMDGDLTTQEFNDIWKKAPKFPDVQEDRIDVDSFVQIYRDIDDLFEEASDEVEAETVTNVAEEGDDEDDVMLEGELATIFASICDKDDLLSKEQLRTWDEVAKLLDEGLLGSDEFDDLWEKTKKTPGAPDKLDVDGFLSFNVALDGLFEFDEVELAVDLPETEGVASANVNGASADDLVVEGDMSPKDLFAALAGQDGLVGKTQLMRWSELQDMLKDGDLKQAELETIFSGASESSKLDYAAFVALYEGIDELFEEVDEDESDVESAEMPKESVQQKAERDSAASAQDLKEELLEMIEDLNSDEEKLPCGLDASELDQRRILAVVQELERESSVNVVRQKRGGIELGDLDGTWELIYSSSSAMRFNQGLSGIGGSFPNGRFAGLKQKLMSSKYLTDVEYTERVEVNPSSASFDVTVTGFWELRQSMSLFTGEPSTVLIIDPDRVTYGPTSTRGDHWKSLGPMNLLDVSYLDEDLRIMRGNTSIETIFILRRC